MVSLMRRPLGQHAAGSHAGEDAAATPRLSRGNRGQAVAGGGVPSVVAPDGASAGEL
jgi:hypothetical protein